MLEICISGFFILSITMSFILWQALVAAKRSDYRLQGANEAYMLEPAEEKFPLSQFVPSTNE
jgi:hypothetical protein